MSIDMLPVELLVSVFEHLQEYETHLTKPDQWTRLSPQWLVIRRVCKHWHAIADDHSRLWSTIDVFASNHTLDWLNLCLSKSGIAELELRSHAPGLMPEVCDALLPHAGRIRTIWASGEETVRGLRALQPLFFLHLSKLQKLHLNHILPWTRDTRFVLTELLGDLTPARLPALHTVALRGIFLLWDSPILRNLRVLKLAYWEQYPGSFDGPYNLPADQFLHALSTCQRLEKLSLKFTNADPHIRRSATSLPVISLPNLRLMELRVNLFESRVLFLPFLAHIRFPQACNIAINGSAGKFDLDPPVYADFLPVDSPESFSALTNAVEATWRGPTAFSCRALGSPLTDRRGGATTSEGAAASQLMLVLKDGRAEDRRSYPDPGPALAQFCEYFARAPRLRKLTLRTSVGAAAYAHAFRRLPNVTELEIEYPFAPRRDAVRGLLSALAGEPGRAVLGGLRVLRLRGLGDYEGFDEDVAECLRSRRAAGACDAEVLVEEVDV